MLSPNSPYLNMLTKMVFGLAIVIPLWLYYLAPGNLSRQNALLLKEAIEEQTQREVMLIDLVPFEWDRLYLFDPYTTKGEMIKKTKVLSPLFRDMYYEEIRNIVFIKGNKVVCNIRGVPTVIGYDFLLQKNQVYAEEVVRLRIVKKEDYIELQEY